MKKAILFIAVIGVALLTQAVFSDAISAQSNIMDGLIRGAELTDPDADPASAEDQVSSIIATIINLFSLVVGVVSVIMIIIGGLKYITSGGDSGNVTAAKNTILYAIIGLVVVALAQVIVRFVISRITGV